MYRDRRDAMVQKLSGARSPARSFAIITYNEDVTSHSLFFRDFEKSPTFFFFKIRFPVFPFPVITLFRRGAWDWIRSWWLKSLLERYWIDKWLSSVALVRDVGFTASDRTEMKFNTITPPSRVPRLNDSRREVPFVGTVTVDDDDDTI